MKAALAGRTGAEPRRDAAAAPEPLGDLRFRALLGPDGWASLPAAVRARFGRRLGPGDTVTYAGRIVSARRTWAGALLAHAARLIGAPLPLDAAPGVAAVVTVTEEPGGGQCWTRLYARPRGRPQVIHSAKRFAGPTGLEEYLGRGVGIALGAEAAPDRLLFRSAHYFVRLGPWRLRLPRLLSPGALTIAHVDLPDGGFAFELTLAHPRFGELIHQRGLFRERLDTPEDRP